MSLLLGGATNDRIDCGSAASIDNLTESTILLWVKINTLTANRVLVSKHDGATNGFTARLSGTGGNIAIFWNRATTSLSFTSTDTPFAATGVWKCVMITISHTGNTIALYVGDLGSPLAASTGTSAGGSGAYSSDAGNTLQWGNRGSDTAAMQGNFAVGAVVTRVMTLAEGQAWQWRPRMVASCAGFWWFGSNGTGSQPDYSGNGNAGTLTGTSLSDFLPLGQGTDARDDHPTASVGAAAQLEASLSAAASVAGGLTTDIQINAALSASGALAAAITTDIRLASALSAAATISPTLATDILMLGSLVAAGSCSAAISTEILLAALLQGSGVVAAALATEIHALAALAASASLAGDLTSLGNLVPKRIMHAGRAQARVIAADDRRLEASQLATFAVSDEP